MASGSPPVSSSPSTSCWVSLSVRASSERPCQKRSASASSSRSQRSCSWQRPRRQPHWDSSCAVRSWIPAGHERDGAQPAAPRGTARDPAPRQSPEQGHGPTATTRVQGHAAVRAHPLPCMRTRPQGHACPSVPVPLAAASEFAACMLASSSLPCAWTVSRATPSFSSSPRARLFSRICSRRWAASPRTEGWLCRRLCSRSRHSSSRSMRSVSWGRCGGTSLVT